MVFVEGLNAIYRGNIGVIRFVSDKYLTFCIRTFPHEKNRDVCILIYRENYGEIKLIKESEK